MLRELAPDIWVADTPFRFMGVEIGARMTVVRLSDGGLFLCSPIDLTPDLRAALETLGPVRFAAAPSKYHFLCLSDYAAAFPDAKIYAAPGLSPQEGVTFQATLGDGPEPEWAADLDQTIYRGNKIADEVVFFHRASRTLILTDMCFHLRGKVPPLTRLIARLGGIYNRFGPSRLDRLLTRDKAAARASLGRILAWDFDRVIVAHGDIVQTGGKAKVRRAFAWLSG